MLDYTDLELMRLIREDDHLTYKELYHRYTGLFYSHAYSRLQNREEAKDLVQVKTIDIVVK